MKSDITTTHHPSLAQTPPAGGKVEHKGQQIGLRFKDRGLFPHRH